MKQRTDLTFRHNLKNGRHGWLRLTPAYSIKVVHKILEEYSSVGYVLDPFSGTGTTGLVCRERGLECDLLDINPFLVWLARVKTQNYTATQLLEVQAAAKRILDEARRNSDDGLWLPPIQNIERWWSEGRRLLLARIYQALHHLFPDSVPAKDLLLVAFCRVVIQWSNAAFNHQSMSFKGDSQQLQFDENFDDFLLAHFARSVEEVIESASHALKGQVRVAVADSRHVQKLSDRRYDCVITSPPYPNRMSYIRELRPYMYWLGYLSEARDAGELDWQAIGGTWGIATSRVGKWKPSEIRIDYPGFELMIHSIAKESQVLANYVHKYFVDIAMHIESVYPQLTEGGAVFYVVGNSKFYETLVPVEAIYASLLQQHGFTSVKIDTLRKRNSKKELYEFLVSAQKPHYL